MFLDWEFGFFRDCNGRSNGRSLSVDATLQEEDAGTFIGIPAGLIGPKLNLRCGINIVVQLVYKKSM